MENEWNNNEYSNNENEQDYAFQTLMRNGKPKTLGWSVASLVVGIISVVCCCFGYSGVIMGAAAIAFAIVSRRQLGYFDGMSIAGLVLGIFGFVFGFSILIFSWLIPEEMVEEFWTEYYKQLEDLEGGSGGDF